VQRACIETQQETDRWLRSADSETRVKWIFGLKTRFFFSAPFVHRHLPADTDVAVAFDVTRCPL